MSNKFIGLVEPFIINSINNEKQICRNAINYLTYNRFDIAFKLYYLDFYYRNYNLARQVYSKHILAFGLGDFKEFGNDNKKNLEDFLSVFNKISNDISTHGFLNTKSVIPLANDNSIANGAHRIASAIFNGTDICSIKTNLPASKYGYKFFKNRGIPDHILDIAAKTFIKFDNKTYIAFIWPIAYQYFPEIINKFDKIVYIKKIKLNLLGLKNLLSQVYLNEQWLGEFENEYSGINNKLNNCYKPNNPVTCVVFQANSFNDVINIKNDIRKICNLDKHSIHITDSKSENINISEVVLNDNSIFFLNNANFTKIKKNKRFIDYIRSNQLNSERIVFDGSIIMSLFGIREYDDIDYLSDIDSVIINSELNFNSHIDQIKFYNKTVADLLYDPINFFYFNGYKFLSLDLIYKMKINRATTKDKMDSILIRKYLNNKNIFIEKLISYILIYRIKIYIFIYKILKFFNLIKIVKLIIGKK